MGVEKNQENLSKKMMRKAGIWSNIQDMTR